MSVIAGTRLAGEKLGHQGICLGVKIGEQFGNEEVGPGACLESGVLLVGRVKVREEPPGLGELGQLAA